MAAYAALVTLMNLTDQIQNRHPRHFFSFDERQIQSLLQNVSFLLDFIEGYSSHGSSKIAEDLESRIAAAAHAAEDVIESRVVNQILDGSTINHANVEKAQKSIKKKVMKAIFTKTMAKSPSFSLDLQKIIQDMDSIKKKVVKVKDVIRFENQQPKYSIPAASSRPLITGETSMVGFDGYLIQLMDVLTGQQCSRQVISIVGMGGIGKTTLARNVYQEPLITQHFDFCAWATISQEYNVGQILSQLLSCKEETNSRTVDQLGEQLYKKLLCSRYLIVLDDMWSDEVWDEINFFFPDNGSRSRIVITSRLSNLSCHSSFLMDLLDEDRSWKLFCQKVFGQDHDCPCELEKIGREIAQQCRGLPLSIVVIGGHLRKSSRTEDYWEFIGNNINSILTSGEDERCLNILHLSYTHLPVYLKPCFLYTGMFPPEDKVIDASTLIKLWVAEGFLKPNKDQSLEEIAESHLKDLVDRNLISAQKWSRNGKIKSCNIHDLLKELCLRVAEKEKFLCVLKLRPWPLDRERRVAIHGEFRGDYFHHEVFYALKSAHLVRSMICKPGQLPFHFKLLKILKIGREVFGKLDVGCLKSKFEQVNLRYLSRELGWGHDVDEFMLRDPISPLCLPSSISRLWNLQTLVIKGRDVKIVAPSEIWEMPQLRHMEFELISLPDPPPRYGPDDAFVLSNLQTLLRVGNFKMSEEVCKRMPNINKLEISYDGEAINSSSEYFQHNLCCLNKLDSLECHFRRRLDWRDFALNLKFPSSIRKLSLSSSCLYWADLTMIGSLPNLEVLKLTGRNSDTESEWIPIEGEFLKLKYLKLEYYDLVQWNADSSHFPMLESLVFRGLSKLSEIPLGIGDIPTLRYICLDECSVSAAISAMRIVEEQEELGNETLQLKVEFWQRKDREMFREMVKEEGLTTNNLLLRN